MKKSLKVLLIILAILAMMSVFATVSFGATEYFEYVDANGNVYTYYCSNIDNTVAIQKIELKNDGTNLIIPDTINGSAVTIMTNNVFYNTKSQKKLESITIPDTMKRINYYAFNNCENLKTVIIGNVSDCVIRTGAFNSCKALETVRFGNTENVTVEKGTFSYLKNLKTVDFGNPTGMIICNECFKGSGVTKITVPKGVSLGQYVFSECPNLVKAEIYASPLKQVEKTTDTRTGKVISERDVFS